MAELTPLLPWHHALWLQLMAARPRLHHALLLHGRRGSGKLEFARTLAKALLCEAPTVDHFPCGGCVACNWFEQGSHPDFRQISPESANPAGPDDKPTEKKASKVISVAEIRELKEFVMLSTHRNGSRVVLIHPAESMNAQAANALLKTLEEPSPNTFFILVSHQTQHLLATIRSRCQKVNMPRPDKEQASLWLQQQGVAAPETILSQAGFMPLEALRLSDEGYQQRRRGLLDQLSRPLEMNPLAVAEHLKDENVAWIIEWLQKWTYDLVASRLSGRIQFQTDYAQTLQVLAKTASLAKLLGFQRELLALQRVVNHPLNPQLLLEQIFLNYVRLEWDNVPHE